MCPGGMTLVKFFYGAHSAMAALLNLGLIEFIHPELRGAVCHRSWNLATPLIRAVQYSFPPPESTLHWRGLTAGPFNASDARAVQYPFPPPESTVHFSSGRRSCCHRAYNFSVEFWYFLRLRLAAHQMRAVKA
jgi:hypothetical protein